MTNGERAMKTYTIKPLVFEKHPMERMEWVASIEAFHWQAVVWKYKPSDKWWFWYVESKHGGGIRGKCRTREAAMKKANAEYLYRVSQLLEATP